MIWCSTWYGIVQFIRWLKELLGTLWIIRVFVSYYADVVLHKHADTSLFKLHHLSATLIFFTMLYYTVCFM